MIAGIRSGDLPLTRPCGTPWAVYAGINGWAHAIRAMQDHGMALFERDQDGYNALDAACALGEDDISLVATLLSCGLEVSRPMPAGAIKPGATPLHWAARAGSALTVELLLGHGHAPNATDGNGYPPLHWTRSTEVATVLVAHGADLDYIHASGETALMQSVLSAKPALAACLVVLGADLSFLDNYGLLTSVAQHPGAEVALAAAVKASLSSSLRQTPVVTAARAYL